MARNIKLITVRLQKGLKAWELAKELNIHPNLYSMFEFRGRMPEAEMKQRIADKLGVKVEDIF